MSIDVDKKHANFPSRPSAAGLRVSWKITRSWAARR